MNIDNIRQTLLLEAQTSPMLLSDLAGLEEYISDSYNNRSFIELLQNADDANATQFIVKKCKDYLLVANNGRTFNQQDIESLCRSASSNKVRGHSIGYRGIGFKSVVSIAKEVHLLSGNFEITFSRELTKTLIPSAERVPLIRIPHSIRKEVKADLYSIIQTLNNDGFTTFFIFSDVVAKKIEEEYSGFHHTALLFLKHVRKLTVDLNYYLDISITSVPLNNVGREVSINMTNNNTSIWQVYSENSIDIAFNVQNNKVVKLAKSEALIHAFLPTEDTCNLGVLLNGDFSTDPSRRHLIFDEKTLTVIQYIAELYIKLLNQLIFIEDEYANNILTALMPHFDVRMLQLMRNTFEKQLINAVKESTNNLFNQLTLMPIWFNAKDFNILQTAKGHKTIGKESYSITNLISLLKCLGAKEIGLSDLIKTENISKIEISIHGCAQLAHAAIKESQLNKIIPNIENIPIYYSQKKRCSLKEIEAMNQEIDQAFLDLIYEKGITTVDMRSYLRKISLLSLCEKQFSKGVNSLNGTEPQPTTDNNKSIDSALFDRDIQIQEKENNEDIYEWLDYQMERKDILAQPTTSRWRSAEELTLEVLNSKGFRLEDVASQNLGYDLEGTDPKGRRIFIEIKSITNAGQKFRMTNNEFAVAQIKQDCYYIAIVMQMAKELEISLIKNPTNTLNLNRQCVQWIWECSDYEYRPMKFIL